MILKDLLENMSSKSLIEINFNNIEFGYTKDEALHNLGEYWLNKEIASIEPRYYKYFEEGYLYVELK